MKKDSKIVKLITDTNTKGIDETTVQKRQRYQHSTSINTRKASKQPDGEEAGPESGTVTDQILHFGDQDAVVAFLLEEIGAVVPAPRSAGANHAAGQKEQNVEDEKQVSGCVSPDFFQISPFG